MIGRRTTIPKWLTLVAILAVGVGMAAAQARSGNFGWGEVVVHTATGSHAFEVEIATTPEQHAQGLMFRRKLAPDAGMLFLYKTPGQVMMWMKNTVIPLDMVFIAPDRKVVRIEERTVPYSLKTLSSGGSVQAVLELNAGAASRIGLKPGDKVEWTLR